MGKRPTAPRPITTSDIRRALLLPKRWRNGRAAARRKDDRPKLRRLTGRVVAIERLDRDRHTLLVLEILSPKARRRTRVLVEFPNLCGTDHAYGAYGRFLDRCVVVRAYRDEEGTMVLDQDSWSPKHEPIRLMPDTTRPALALPSRHRH